MHSQLNPPQQQAVCHQGGPLVVFAGAGSGKTRVITHRIAHLVKEQGVPPFRILAVTFTNKAAQEMRARVSRLIGTQSPHLWVGTFHSTSAKLLRTYADQFGVPANFTIYDDTDQRSLISRVIKDLKLDDRRYLPKAVAGIINRAKQEAQTPSDLDTYDYFTEKVQEIYQNYEERKELSSALDFGDLLMRVVLGLRDNERLLNHLRHQFQYLLVDEFQDTNQVQYELVSTIAQQHRQVCVVGDDDQGIYRWRGADRRNILHFKKDFPDSTIVKLEQNYRSTKRILGAANAVIQRSTSREPKSLWTDNAEGDKVKVLQCFDERDEARIFVEQAQGLVSSGSQLEDIALFYRIHAQSRVFEEALRAADIPYRIIGGVRFYERAEIKDLLAYLRLVANHHDDVSLLRIINVPTRGIGKTTLEKLTQLAQSHRISVWEAIKLSLSSDYLGAATSKKIAHFVQMIEVLSTKADSPADLLHEIITATEFRKRLEQEDSVEADARIQNIDEFVGSVLEFERDAEVPTLDSFLELVTLQTDADTAAEGERITLMTVHAAKGLEFPAVFVAGLEEGMFPFKGAEPDDDPEELEEERRLAYVAFTRAERKLMLSFAHQRRMFGRLFMNLPSRFIDEIPLDLVEREGSPDTGSYRGAWHEDPYEQPEQIPGESYIDTSDAHEDPSLTTYSRVRHPKFGVGTVLRVTQGNPAKITVAFPGWGRKTIAANYLLPA